MEQSADTIYTCHRCGVKNRVPSDKNPAEAKCGRCRSLLAQPDAGHPDEYYKIRCLQCRTRNRIPATRLEAGPKCGKCQAPLAADAVLKPQPMMISDASFEETVIQSPLPVLLFCWAPWCPSCGAVTPIIEEFARDARGKVRVGKLNIDANPATASKFNILSVPYLFIFDNGELKDSLPGGLQKYELMMKMAHYI